MLNLLSSCPSRANVCLLSSVQGMPGEKRLRIRIRASSSSIPKKKNAVVVGAGPAGCLMAIYLIRRNYHVHLLERRPMVFNEAAPDPVYAANDARSYTMLLTSRALLALEAAEVQLPSSLLGPLVGGCAHLPNGSTRVFHYSSDPGLQSFGVSRNALVAYLQKVLLKRYPDHVTTRFGCELTDIDVDASTAVFQSAAESSSSAEVEYDLLVGADGVSSRTRSILLEQGGTNSEEAPMTLRFTPNPERYKSFYVRPSIAKGSQFYAHHNYVQAWPALNILMVGMADGSFWGGSKHPQLVKAEQGEQVEEIFKQKAPELYDLLVQENPNFAEVYANQPAIPFSGAIILSRFHHRNIVLIGDAAHGMFPSYGTGCNVALEDCRLLDQIIQEAEAHGAEMNISAVASEFTRRRLADAHAIVDMNSTLELLPRGPIGMLQVAVRSALQKLLPRFIKPSPYQLLWSDVPFTQIKQQKRIENIISYSLLFAAAASAVKIAATCLWRRRL